MMTSDYLISHFYCIIQFGLKKNIRKERGCFREHVRKTPKKQTVRSMSSLFKLCRAFGEINLLFGCYSLSVVKVFHTIIQHTSSMSRLHSGETAKASSLLNLFIHHQHSHRHMAFSITISTHLYNLVWRLKITVLSNWLKKSCLVLNFCKWLWLLRSKDITQTQQISELPTVILTWQVCKYKVQKLHQSPEVYPHRINTKL